MYQELWKMGCLVPPYKWIVVFKGIKYSSVHCQPYFLMFAIMKRELSIIRVHITHVYRAVGNVASSHGSMFYWRVVPGECWCCCDIFLKWWLLMDEVSNKPVEGTGVPAQHARGLGPFPALYKPGCHQSHTLEVEVGRSEGQGHLHLPNESEAAARTAHIGFVGA